MLAQLIYFVGVGTIATGIHYAILIILVETGGATPAVASGIGYSLSAVANYLLNYYLTFKSEERHKAASVKFAIVAAGGLVLNSVAMLFFTQFAGLYYLFSQVLATVIVLFWNFFVNRKWTYRVADRGRV